MIGIEYVLQRPYVGDSAGPTVTEAWYAAPAIEWGCEWVTLDRDYARFSDCGGGCRLMHER